MTLSLTSFREPTLLSEENRRLRREVEALQQTVTRLGQELRAKDAALEAARRVSATVASLQRRPPTTAR